MPRISFLKITVAPPAPSLTFSSVVGGGGAARRRWGRMLRLSVMRGFSRSCEIIGRMRRRLFLPSPSFLPSFLPPSCVYPSSMQIIRKMLSCLFRIRNPLICGSTLWVVRGSFRFLGGKYCHFGNDNEVHWLFKQSPSDPRLLTLVQNVSFSSFPRRKGSVEKSAGSTQRGMNYNHLLRLCLNTCRGGGGDGDGEKDE